MALLRRSFVNRMALLVPDWLRNLYVLVRYVAQRFQVDRCTQTASSLTYTSLLALVPLLTVLLLILSAFPAFKDMEADFRDLITTYTAPDLANRITPYLDDFSNNAENLGAIGIAGLLVTSVMLLFTIEKTFNTIWRVEKSRSVIQRSLAFWAVLTLSPILFALSATLSHSISAALNTLPVDAIGPVLTGLSGLLPLFVQAVAITVMFLALPNRRTRWKDALIGGFCTSVALEIAKIVFRAFFADSATYTSIYGQVAIVPIFMVWLYLLWTILLAGAEIAAALPEWRAGFGEAKEPNAILARKSLGAALSILDVVMDGVHRRRPAKIDDLHRRIPHARLIVERTSDLLVDLGWLARGEQGEFLMARDLYRAPLLDLMTDLGLRPRSDFTLLSQDRHWVLAATTLLRDVEAAEDRILSLPVRDLLRPTDRSRLLAEAPQPVTLEKRKPKRSLPPAAAAE